jgi:hypothetical protein
MNYQEINLNNLNNSCKEQGCLESKRIPLERFRKALGKTGVGKSDEEIKSIMDLQYKSARVLHKFWVKQ